jgi:co-chaperonin GroES (HSP10)
VVVCLKKAGVMMVDKVKDILNKIIKSGMRPVLRMGVLLLWDEVSREIATEGGIILPPVVVENDNYREATVVRVGRDINVLSSGDRVLVGKFYGTEIKHEDSDTCKLVLVSGDQIAALIED